MDNWDGRMERYRDGGVETWWDGEMEKTRNQRLSAPLRSLLTNDGTSEVGAKTRTKFQGKKRQVVSKMINMGGRREAYQSAFPNGIKILTPFF